MAEIEKQVAAGTDDCYRKLVADTWNLASTVLYVGRYAADNKQQGCGMRFTGVTIPHGAMVLEAHLTVRAQTARSSTTFKSYISAEDVNDAATFADDSAAFDTRYAGRTTAKVAWEPSSGWLIDTDYESPDIKTVLQEVFDRPGWVSGNDIVIFWEDYDDRSTGDEAQRVAYSYEGSSTYAPKLVITYIIEQAVGGGKISKMISMGLL